MMDPQVEELRAQTDELLINYKGGLLKSEQMSEDWTPVWNKFRSDICSFIIPEIRSHKEGSQPPKVHNFSIPSSTQQLRRVILSNAQLDIFPQIRKQVLKIFYEIANSFVANTLKAENPLMSFLSGYAQIASKINIMISTLTMVLTKYITRRGIEKEFHCVVNKQLNNHALYQNFVSDCLEEIEQFRDNCLVNQLPSELADHPLINKIKLLNLLTVFPYLEYLERSKKYYSELLARIPKNLRMFGILHSYIQIEKLLASIIPKDQQKLQKIGFMDTWRANEPDCMIRILSKEIIAELHPDMIEYVDFLIQNDEDGESPKQLAQFLQVSKKRETLKHLWEITKVLERNLQKIRSPLNSDNKVMSAENRLLNRVISIIGDTKKFIVNSGSEGKLTLLFKIIQFKDNIQTIVEDCFDSDSKFLNAIINNIQATIAQQEDLFNQKLCQVILSEKYICPITNPTPENLAFTPRKPKWRNPSFQNERMVEEEQQRLFQAEDLNNQYSYELFKLTPSKEQFIRKFEQEFSKIVLSDWNEDKNLTHQEYFIRAMQKQCGNLLCRNIEKMLGDVWKNGELLMLRHQIFCSRVLSQDWPEFMGRKYKLNDYLLDLRESFELSFKAIPENDKKKLTWIQDCGRLTIHIAGIISVFSELQTSIILTLSKSFRPMKASQLWQILEYNGPALQIQQILDQMSDGGILIHNEHGNNFQVNYENLRAYEYNPKDKIAITKQKKVLVRDRGIIVEAFVARILKRKKTVQKTDLTKLLGNEMKGTLPSHQEIHQALQKLRDRDIIGIEKTRGIIRYIQ